MKSWITRENTPILNDLSCSMQGGHFVRQLWLIISDAKLLSNKDFNRYYLSWDLYFDEEKLKTKVKLSIAYISKQGFPRSALPALNASYGQ